MYDLGKITKEEYDEAVAQPLEFKTTTLEITQQVPNWFVDQVFEDVSRICRSSTATQRPRRKILS